MPGRAGSGNEPPPSKVPSMQMTVSGLVDASIASWIDWPVFTVMVQGGSVGKRGAGPFCWMTGASEGTREVELVGLPTEREAAGLSALAVALPSPLDVQAATPNAATEHRARLRSTADRIMVPHNYHARRCYSHEPATFTGGWDRSAV